MSSFTRARFEATGERRNGRALYRITDGLTFDVGYLGSGVQVRVPAGFVTDGPTMPAWAARLLPARTMMKAAAVHDRLREDPRFSKADGDGIFYVAMCAEGTPVWLRWPAFLAVCLNRSRAQHQQVTA